MIAKKRRAINSILRLISAKGGRLQRRRLFRGTERSLAVKWRIHQESSNSLEVYRIKAILGCLILISGPGTRSVWKTRGSRRNQKSSSNLRRFLAFPWCTNTIPTFDDAHPREDRRGSSSRGRGKGGEVARSRATGQPSRSGRLWLSASQTSTAAKIRAASRAPGIAGWTGRRRSSHQTNEGAPPMKGDVGLQVGAPGETKFEVDVIVILSRGASPDRVGSGLRHCLGSGRGRRRVDPGGPAWTSGRRR